MSKKNWIWIGGGTLALVIAIVIYAYASGLLGGKPEKLSLIKQKMASIDANQSWANNVKEKAKKRGNTFKQQKAADALYLARRKEGKVNAEQAQAIKDYFGLNE